MKKLIALLLAFALCFGLAACSSGSCDNCEDYEDLIEHLENGEYTQAVKWITDFASSKKENNNSVDGNSSLEEKYQQLVGYLENLEESLQEGWTFNIYYTPEGSEEGQWLSGNDAYLYLYEQLTALGDYKDSQELASRFTLVEDVLLNITSSYTDALGNKREESYGGYQYNANGQLVKGPAPAEWNYCFGGDRPNYEYDDSGRLVCLRNVLNDTTRAILNITYNADGTMAAADLKTADGRTATHTYIYEDGLLTQCDLTGNYLWADRIETYTYNAAGQVERVENSCKNQDLGSDIELTLYTYNTDGTVATERTSTLYSFGEHYVYLYSYTYDSQGRVTTVLSEYKGNFDAEGNPMESDTGFDTTYTYNYGSCWVYTPVG